jgi:protein SCO1/2
MTRQQALPLLSLAIVTTLLIWAIFIWNPAPGGTATPATPTGGDFTLHSATGPISLTELRDKVVLLYFGYTSCPDICPTSLTLMSIALSQLSTEESAQVRGLFVSVDPERDTPQRLAQYSSHFHPNISGITGSPAEVAEVARLYGAVYQRAEGDTALGYTIDHSSVTYLIDPQGRLTMTLPHGTTPGAILQQIRRLLQTNP